MDAKKRYEDWLENPYFDENTKNELEGLQMTKKKLKKGSTRNSNSVREVCAESLVPAQTG